MARRTCLAAWDFVIAGVEHIARIGYRDEQMTEFHKSLQDELQRLTEKNLDVETIYLVGQAIRSAYNIGLEAK